MPMKNILDAMMLYNAQPTTTPDAIMDAAKGYIAAQSAKETGEYILGMPKAALETKNLKLRNALMLKQLRSMPYSDSDDLEDSWNEDDGPSPTSKIAKILATRYLESTTNSLSKVGHYGITPRTGSGVSSFLAKLL